MNVPMEYIESTIPPGMTIEEWRAQQPRHCSFCKRVTGQVHMLFCIYGRPTSPVVR